MTCFSSMSTTFPLSLQSFLSILIGLINNKWLIKIRLMLLWVGEDDGTPLQYSCLENPMDRGACQTAVHGVAKSRTRLSDLTFTFPFMHWRRKWQPTPVFLPGESQGRGSLVGCRLWVAQSQTWLKRLSRKLGVLQSMGSRRVGHDWVNWTELNRPSNFSTKYFYN